MTDKPFLWDAANDRSLRAVRGISFDEIAIALSKGPVHVERNWSRRHPGQRVFVVWIDQYPWVVPFDETAETIYLRTAYPSRRFKPRSEQ